MKLLGRSLRASLLLWAIAVSGWAQLYTGSVTGVVTDPQNATVPNAEVNLVDSKKGFVFNAPTESNGRYLIRSVPPGTYNITVTAPGFRPETRNALAFQVNQNLTVDFSLRLGNTSESIQITAEAPLLATQDSVTGQVLNRKLINDLPLIDRSVLSLAYLTPGIVSTNPGSNNSGNNFVSNGGRNATADVLMDGVSTTNYEQNSGVQVPSYTPSVESVEEFSVQQSNFSAEFGFSGATIVNMVTRSGTNEFHGSAYDFLRNSALDANNFFNNSAGVPISPLKRNNFGATFGGPIRRNKTFFFVDYDGNRETTMSSGNVFGVPSTAERQGNFGELCGANGGGFDSSGLCSSTAGQLWDPYSGVYDSGEGGAVRSTYVPFNNLATYQSPGNPNLNGTPFQVAGRPGNLIDPVALKLMQYFPAPNLGVGSDAYDPYNNYLASGAVHAQNDQFDVRVDNRFSDKNLLSLKYSQALSNSDSFNCFGNLADPCTSGPGTGSAHLFSLNDSHTFGPALVLNVSYGWNRAASLQGGIGGSYPELNPSTTLGLPNYMNVSGTRALPYIDLGDYSPEGGNIGTQPWSYVKQGNDTHQLLATLSWVKGSHELKFGAEGRLHRINFVNPGPTGGEFGFDRSQTNQSPSDDGGDAMASFLTGVGGNGYYEVPNFVSSQNFQWGGFVQDNWKLTRNFTLNLGLRYDVSLPRTERYNRMNSVDPNVVSPLQVPGLGTLHGGEVFASSSDRYVYDPDLKNFQPRVGFSWSPTSNTVIRGGYGIFYSTTKAGAAGPGAWGYEGFLQDTNWISTYNNDGATPGAPLSNPFPGSGPKLPPGSSLGLLNDIGQFAWGPIKNLNATPYQQTWSFGIQRELPWQILIEANYVGMKGTHLYYGGAGDLDHLGPQVERYSVDQIAGLNDYVPNPFFGIVTDSSSSLSAPTVQAYQLQLPFPQFTGIGGDPPPVGNSIYSALQTKIEKRFSSGLQFLVTYTFSKSIDDTSVTDDNISWLGGRVSLQDPNNYALERSVSQFDDTHVFQFSYVYELPFGHNKLIGSNWNPVVNAVLGGWQTNGIWRFDSGFPLAASLSGSYNHPIPTYGGQRPNLSGTPVKNTGPDSLTSYFSNPEVFSMPAIYTLGNAPRTLPWIRQPGMRNGTASLFKSFPLSTIREGSRLEFRIEAFNVLNHVQFAAPNMTVGSSNFGLTTRQANLPREVQLALKFYW